MAQMKLPTWVVGGGLAAWNYVVNRRLPARLYVPANLAVAAATAATGRAAGLTPAEMGVDGDAARRSVGVAVSAAGAVAAGVLVASRLPGLAGLFDDVRASHGNVAFETLLRIPLGTVVLEEVAFRGVLPAMIDGSDRTHVSIATAAWFGLWHVLPTLNALDINGVSDRTARAAAVAGGVVGTVIAALAFDKLRLASGSVVAPMFAHWSANAVGYAVAAGRA